MATEIDQEELVLTLFNLNRDYFFEKTCSVKAEDLIEDPSIIALPDEDGFANYFTLKKEFRSKLETLSFSEAIQWMHIASSQSKIDKLSKKISSIEGWVTFLGILAIVSIVVAIFMTVATPAPSW